MAEQEFKTKIKDGVSKQDFLMWLDGNNANSFNGYFSGLDGEIESSGANISIIDGNTDLRFGSVVNPALSVNLINKNNAMSSVNIGEIKAYAGVCTGVYPRSAQEQATWKLKLQLQLCDMYIVQKDDGIYVNEMVDSETEEYAERKISNLQAYAFIGFSQAAAYEKDSIIKVFTEQGIYTTVADFSEQTFSDFGTAEIPNAYLLNKPIDNMAIYYSFDGMPLSFVDTKEAREGWVYELIGDFKTIEKTANNDTLSLSCTSFSNIIDSDATNLLTGFVGYYVWFFQRMSQEIGQTIYTYGLDFLGESFPYELFRGGQYTYRNALEIIAEKYGYFVRQSTKRATDFSEEIVFEFVRLNKQSVAADTITTSNIAQNSLNIGQSKTTDADVLTIRSTGGTSVEIGNGSNRYIVYGNPLISAPTQSYLNTCSALPNYYPISFREIFSDPSVCLYDIIKIEQVETQSALTDSIGYMLTDNQDVALVVENDSLSQIPVMGIEINWNGKFSTVYSANGNETREENIVANDSYTAKLNPVASFNDNLTQLDVFNKLTNNGETQGIYINNGKIYINGQYIQGQTISGNTLSGNTISGNTINGNTISGGTISGSTINGNTISGGSITGSVYQSINSKVYYVSNYSQSDVNRLTDIILGRVTPTQADYNKLDFNCDGVLDSFDGAVLADMLLQNANFIITWSVKIDPSNPNEILYVNVRTECGSNVSDGRMLSVGSSFVKMHRNFVIDDNNAITKYEGGVRRMRLDHTGLYFYNTSGQVTHSYTA